MKFTLSWLKDHLDTEASLDTISETLTAIGLEVEEIEDRSSIYAPFKVAEVLTAEQHPDADRLQVLTVNTGEEQLQVVCGAPNAKAGMKGIFAPVGSYIPGLEIELKKGVIRGVESHGMMVSEREMNLSDEHTGIIELSEDTDYALGTPMAEIFGLDDPVIDIALTPNRGDCAGIRGIARDLAAAGLGTLKPLNTDKIQGHFDTPVGINLNLPEDAKDACPLFVGRMVKGVKNGPSPKWMQDRLKAVGLRPISALVDITNYVSLDLCRPLHVFDADTLQGNIHVRLSEKGETLEALNDKSYTLDDGMIAICDDSGVLGLGGVVGGVPSSCTEGTTNVIIESAYFDPMRIAKTGRALSIDSDARYRFERGVDPVFTIEAMEIATRLVQELCGGEAGNAIIAGDIPAWERTIEFDPTYTKKLSGLDVPAATQKTILETLGFEVKGNGPFSVTPPSWRPDIEGRADLVEEVIRIHGYDKLESLSMKKDSTITHSGETENMTRIRKSRNALAARGMNECVTWSFLSKTIAQKFGANDDEQATAQLTLQNPLSSEMDQMRPSLLPNLIDALKRNEARGFDNNALFEIGPAFQSGKPEGQPIIVCGVRSSAIGARHWSSKEAARPIDALDAKADAIAALDAAGAPTANLQVTRDAPDWYHPGRSGALRLGKNILATFGELHPATLEDMDVSFPVTGFEICLNNIPAQKKKKSSTTRPPLKLSAFQPVSRDFAFIVDEGVAVSDLIKAAQNADKQLISNIDVFDVYQGKGVEEGKKSVALNITLQPIEKTLTDEELEAFSRKMIDTIASRTGGQLRG